MDRREEFALKLKDMIDAHGKDLYNNSDKLRAYAMDCLPEFRAERNLLVSIVGLDIPKSLLESSEIEITCLKLVNMCREELFLEESAAKYIVYAVAYSLNLCSKDTFVQGYKGQIITSNNQIKNQESEFDDQRENSTASTSQKTTLARKPRISTKTSINNSEQPTSTKSCANCHYCETDYGNSWYCSSYRKVVTSPCSSFIQRKNRATNTAARKSVPNKQQSVINSGSENKICGECLHYNPKTSTTGYCKHYATRYFNEKICLNKFESVTNVVSNVDKNSPKNQKTTTNRQPTVTTNKNSCANCIYCSTNYGNSWYCDSYRKIVTSPCSSFIQRKFDDQRENSTASASQKTTLARKPRISTKISINNSEQPTSTKSCANCHYCETDYGNSWYCSSYRKVVTSPCNGFILSSKRKSSPKPVVTKPSTTANTNQKCDSNVNGGYNCPTCLFCGTNYGSYCFCSKHSKNESKSCTDYIKVNGYKAVEPVKRNVTPSVSTQQNTQSASKNTSTKSNTSNNEEGGSSFGSGVMGGLVGAFLGGPIGAAVGFGLGCLFGSKNKK